MSTGFKLYSPTDDAAGDGVRGLAEGHGALAGRGDADAAPENRVGTFHVISQSKHQLRQPLLVLSV